MKEGHLLRKLIHAGARIHRATNSEDAAEELIHQERAKRHQLLANNLERLVRYGAMVSTTER